MHDHIESIDLCKRIHFELASPLAVLPDPVDVVFNRLVVFNKELVEVFVFFDVFHSLDSQVTVLVLISQQLVCDSSE